MRAIAWAALVAGIVGVWGLVGQLSTDALGMLTGLIFGSLAGIPAGLLVLYTVRTTTPPPPRRDVHLVTSDDFSRRLLE